MVSRWAVRPQSSRRLGRKRTVTTADRHILSQFARAVFSHSSTLLAAEPMNSTIPSPELLECLGRRADSSAQRIRTNPTCKRAAILSPLPKHPERAMG
ncbi:hypothetical protein RB12404 [Rhodopirellula baltica SH 1]|uniref:Uncharacterized protein n=1 Tax=Rhodopirellula baltica (strain DSM 10527 / NCIMB 13988 / SH1) TaxID=243090 RepID=Q7UIP8_RHOBA|nr:hypothetical protein RB12404 [Rhodopirellula baltica SH 1]